jgi:hypothetical protein
LRGLDSGQEQSELERHRRSVADRRLRDSEQSRPAGRGTRTR